MDEHINSLGGKEKLIFEPQRIAEKDERWILTRREGIECFFRYKNHIPYDQLSIRLDGICKDLFESIEKQTEVNSNIVIEPVYEAYFEGKPKC